MSIPQLTRLGPRARETVRERVLRPRMPGNDRALFGGFETSYRRND